MCQRMPFSNDELDFTYPLPAYFKDQPSCYIYIYNGKVVTDPVNVPDSPTILHDGIKDVETKGIVQYIGALGEKLCYAIGLESHNEIPEEMQLVFLRDLIGQIDERMLALAGRAIQLIEFELTSKFCGRCGTLNETLEDRGKKCPKCDLLIYPRISPAIIVLVMKGDEVLLARSSHFRSDMYSIIAGFVEPGETLEHAVKREVMEEVGLKIKNIRYFASQPWPFPNSLMIGFIADYEEGEICVDGNEIIDAEWFRREELPNFPGKTSISGHLIDWFVKMADKK
ncbi:NAD(+) diphosphatase [Methanomethylovorans sp.]|uniref:NAD(+) diphosphatase n=2 Tax=Methanomethylovorans sp. TaxID=2758717 RepID=UPI00351CA9A9